MPPIPQSPPERQKRSYKKKELKTIFSLTIFNGYSIDIKDSANAWWTDPGKLGLLTEAFRWGATIEQACVHAGITKRKYKYFAKLHPDFHTVRKMCSLSLALAVKRNIANAIYRGDWKTTKWFAERAMAEEFCLPRIRARLSIY